MLNLCLYKFKCLFQDSIIRPQPLNHSPLPTLKANDTAIKYHVGEKINENTKALICQRIYSYKMSELLDQEDFQDWWERFLRKFSLQIEAMKSF